MSATLKQISIALISVVSLLGISNTSQAAKFNFTLNDSPGYRGTLEFNNSQLTGIGTETLKLYQLPDSNPYVKPNPYYSFNLSDSYKLTNEPVFDFYNGYLTGVHANYNYDQMTSPGQCGCAYNAIFNLLGSSWQNKYEYHTFNPPSNSSGEKFGAISFETIEPISPASVPEPSTSLAVALGIAGILGFRHRFSK